MPTEPRWLPLSAVVGFNRRVVEKFGGRHALWNVSALKLALASPWNIWIYSKIDDPAVLAATLLADIASVNAFADGNKRTAFLCATAFSEVNGYSFTMPDSEISAETLRQFAERRFGEKALAEWLRFWISG